MTEEEKAEMVGVLYGHMEEGDYLTELGLVPVGGLVTIVTFCAFWGLIAFTAVAKVLYRIKGGVVVSYLDKPTKKPIYLPVNYPCFQMPVVED
ncbi:hypothetical protein HZB93_00400 [Candidatus Falkowbacteria bacterium]|nr:hypothetical protein [Candidatus Falkowbacteria bacterium]